MQALMNKIQNEDNANRRQELVLEHMQRMMQGMRVMEQDEAAIESTEQEKQSSVAMPMNERMRMMRSQMIEHLSHRLEE
jgi:hypothetical protein